MEPAQTLQQLDLVVGRVTAAEPHAGARGHSALLTIEVGPRGTVHAPLPLAPGEARALVDTQVVCAIGAEDVVVLAVHSHGAGVVVLRPDRDVEDGSPVA